MERVPLHDVLCGILKEFFPDKRPHCYYEPPASIQLLYPCIVYHYDDVHNKFADNKRYKLYKRYSVTVIDQNPDSKISDKILDLPYCSLDRVYSADGLTHFVHSLYYDGERLKEEEE